MVIGGYSFQEGPATIDVNVDRMLTELQSELDQFARYETLATHVVDVYKRNDNEAIRALDRTQLGQFSSSFWQTKDWFWNLQKVVPYLILEALKGQPKNQGELAKSHKFWATAFKWRPKSMSPDEETAKKYLETLKSLRKQQAALQQAFSDASETATDPIKVGKFNLYDAVGAGTKEAEKVIKRATKAMTGIGLGKFCYGKVTLVDSSKLASGSAAFYVKNTDEVFLSPNLKGEDVRALCHELAHRLYLKANLRRQADTLYNLVKSSGAWVTSYAKTNPEENLCEMVSFAAIRKLDKNGQDALRPAVPGIKLARKASAANVVRRFKAYAETDDEFVTVRVVTRGEGHKAIKDICDFFKKTTGKSYEKIRFFCESDKNLISSVRPLDVSNVAQKGIPSDERYPEMETTFQVDNIGSDGLLRLILFLKWMGSAGSSREILVQQKGDKKPVHLTSFDGDGPDGIMKLEVNGETIETGDGHGFNGLTD